MRCGCSCVAQRCQRIGKIRNFCYLVRTLLNVRSFIWKILLFKSSKNWTKHNKIFLNCPEIVSIFSKFPINSAFFLTQFYFSCKKILPMNKTTNERTTNRTAFVDISSCTEERLLLFRHLPLCSASPWLLWLMDYIESVFFPSLQKHVVDEKKT